MKWRQEVDPRIPGNVPEWVCEASKYRFRVLQTSFTRERWFWILEFYDNPYRRWELLYEEGEDYPTPDQAKAEAESFAESLFRDLSIIRIKSNETSNH